jgi:hypothetical protein
MRKPWQSKQRQGKHEDQAEHVTASEHEGSLSGLQPLHVDPEDDRPSREDVEAEKQSRRPRPGA